MKPLLYGARSLGLAMVAQPTITVNNTGLKPWTADNHDFTVESHHTKAASAQSGCCKRTSAISSARA
jgi:hypothetical protein